jgi:hypothetical protein
MRVSFGELRKARRREGTGDSTQAYALSLSMKVMVISRISFLADPQLRPRASFGKMNQKIKQ